MYYINQSAVLTGFYVDVLQAHWLHRGSHRNEWTSCWHVYANKATVCGNEAKLIRVTWRETQPNGHSADVSLHAAMCRGLQSHSLLEGLCLLVCSCRLLQIFTSDLLTRFEFVLILPFPLILFPQVDFIVTLFIPLSLQVA